MKLVIMTTSTFFVEEDKILATLFDEGMDDLHLYKPGSSPIYSERLLSLLPDNCYNKITVHDHFYLKEEYGLAGIHLDTPEAQPPLGYRGKPGRTSDTLSGLRELKKASRQVFLRNVLSAPQDGIEASFTMNELEKAAHDGLIDKNVYAWGGISADNIRTMRELGFGGVVVCEDLWKRFEIHSQTDYKELLSHFARLRKAVG